MASSSENKVHYECHPRPVLFFKLRLRHSRVYHEFQITKEEPKETRVNRAKLRQAANIARERVTLL